MSDPYIRRTAVTLIRRYGDRAKAEALVWCRHFAATGETGERLIWARIALAVRAGIRTGSAPLAAG